MKSNNRDCKIVQDLLPNYIENLTDEVTNEYIEEHIATCAECAQVLKDMNGDLKLEQINQEHEIKYLKGIRRRVRRIILAVTIAIILIAGGVIGYVYKKSQIQVNNYTFLRADYIIKNEEGNEVGTLIAVFDENEICKSVRCVEDYNEDKYQAIRDIVGGHRTNLKVLNNKMYYNTNAWNGLSKEKVKEFFVTDYPIIEIEEI